VSARGAVRALWGVLTVAFGYIGLRVLAMPATVWAGAAPMTLCVQDPFSGRVERPGL
jgi:hypothetical protein